MGCFLDFLSDGLGELMCLIIPDSISAQKIGCFLEMLIKLISVVLMVTIFLGVILKLNDDVIIKSIGTKMIYIPLIIYVVFIVLGIITKKKK